MSQQPTSPPPDPQRPNINIEAGGDLNAGTFVGGNVTTTTTTNTNTHVGFNASQVQRLLITVGMLVFVTAGCFFTGGLAVGSAAFVALNRPVFSDNQEAALRFQSFLEDLRALPPGQSFSFGFTEEEISSYFRLILGPQLGINNGKVRLLEVGTLVVAGQTSDLGNIPFAATFEITDEIGAPLKLKAAALQILRLGDSSFGWVAVPTGLLQNVETNINDSFGRVEIKEVRPQAADTWVMTGVSH